MNEIGETIELIFGERNGGRSVRIGEGCQVGVGLCCNCDGRVPVASGEGGCFTAVSNGSSSTS